ncbi:MAG: efflux RND transporter periplasmic adaptor subunit [Acidiferrobacterales bacterium]|nr:efflux RND transporter periplasmic adaptor subunit [Acidiferrobacterales bacterium]
MELVRNSPRIKSVEPRFSPSQNREQQLSKLGLPQFDPQTTYAQFLRLSEAHQDRNAYLLAMLQHAVSVSRAHGAAYFVSGVDGTLSLGPRLLSRDLLSKAPDALDTIIDLARECATKGYSFHRTLQHDSAVDLIFSPVIRSDSAKEVICLAVANRSAGDSNWGLFTQLLAGYVNLWESNTANRQFIQESQFTSGLIEVVSHVNAATDPERGLVTLTSDLANMSGANRVAIGIRPTGKKTISLKQISGTDEVNKRGEFNRLLELCFNEANNYGDMILISDSAESSSQSHFGGHQQFLRLNKAQSMLSLPLVNEDGSVIGVITYWWIDASIPVHFPRHASAGMTPLSNAVQALTQRPSSNYRGLLGSKGYNGSRIFALLLALAITAAMFIPVPHRISSDILIQPVAQRILSVPFDAILERVRVQPGDIVEAGDILAELDGQELQWNLETLQADLIRVKKQKDLKVAERDTQAAQLARLEMERIELEMNLITRRIENLKMVSPISGIVISGDVEKKQGSLVQQGKALFEVAPLDRVNAEIRIAAKSFPYVEGGLPVEIFIDAIPNENWQARLEKIQPRAVVVDSETVFIAPVTLGNENKKIRPGMKGKASIVKDDKPLGWVLFHNAYEQVRVWFRAKFG